MNIIYIYIYIYIKKKLSSLPFFLCGVCFAFFYLQWSCITREQMIWQVVWLFSELIEKFNFILFYDCTKMILLNFMWRSIFQNIWWIYGYLYLGLVYNLYAKYGMLQYAIFIEICEWIRLFLWNLSCGYSFALLIEMHYCDILCGGFWY